jgi:hypothetical protein
MDWILMAYAFVQSGQNHNVAGAANLASSSITVTAGNTLLVWLASASNVITSPPTGNGNTFTNVFVSPQNSGLSYLQCWICQNAASGATVVTPQGAPLIYGIFVEEISGLVTTGGVLASASAVYASSTIAANSITPGNINVTSKPAGLFGFAYGNEALGNTNLGDPQFGTSLAYNDRTTGWVGGSSNKTAVAEDIRVTSTGNITTTFGVANDQFDNFSVGCVALLEIPPPTYALVGTGTAVSGFDITLTPIVPAAAVVGNLLLMQTSISIDSTAPPLISGWTQLSPNYSGGATLTSLALYGKIATSAGGAGSSDNPSFTWGNVLQDAYIMAFSGNPTHLNLIVDNSAFLYTGATSTNNVAYASLTPTTANCLVIAGGTRIKTAAANGATWATYGSFTIGQSLVQTGATMASVMNYWAQSAITTITAGAQTYSPADSSAQLYQSYILSLGQGLGPVGGTVPRLIYVMP